MARFNTQTVSTTKTVNRAGGEAYKQTDQVALTSLVLTSMLKDQFYRPKEETLVELRNLLNKNDALFCAKLAVYARKTHGLRSISHVIAAELAPRISGETWAKKFYEEVINRPDDMLEIVSYYKAQKDNKSLPSALKKGFRNKMSKLSAYEIAKYRGEGKQWKMVDLTNLVHPKPTEQNMEAYSALVADTLRNTDTWETKLSAAGNEENVEEAKAEAWKELVENKTIGYFALLRNLRNIIQQAPTLVPAVAEMLVDEKRIRKSLVLPFRYLTAIREIESINSSESRKIVMALNKAVEISCVNVPTFEGKTLVVLDESGSMGSFTNPSSAWSIGSVFAAVILKTNPEADFMTFDTRARYKVFNPQDSVYTIARNDPNGGGTDFKCIFTAINKGYDRIIVLSDMQGWVGYHTPQAEFNHYKTQYGVNTKVFSFDLTGYGTTQFSGNVFALAGFSEKTLEVMAILEKDKNAMINEINKISL